MNCLYCQRACTLIAHDPEGKIIPWECQNQNPTCGARFNLLKDVGMFNTTWRDIIVNGHKFFVKLYDETTGNAPEFIIYYYAVNDLGKHYWEEVLRFDFIPEGWTPHNIAEKLKTHLPYL